ncbi:MAG: fatty acid desaturase [Alphaproteobacteria bacterium]
MTAATKKTLLQRLNWPAVIVLLVLPPALIAAAVAYHMHYGIGAAEIIMFVVTYYICNISIGVAMHRLWAHGAYKTKRWVEVVFMLTTAMTLQGPALAWSSDHNRHHSHTDGEKDPHSPLKYKNPVMGFLWSHIGWMLVTESSIKNLDRATMIRLGKNPVLIFQMNYYWQVATFMNVAVPAFVGWMVIGGWQGVAGGLLACGLGRAFQQQITFCVNSLVHFFGKRTYTANTSRDLWWFFPFLLGENWHNFHHAFARDYRNGHKWYHADVHKWIIAGMEKCGLAWDLVRTSEERIHAKVVDTSEKLEAQRSGLADAMDRARKALEEARGEAKEAVEAVLTHEVTVESSMASVKNRAIEAASTAAEAGRLARESAEARLDKARSAAHDVAETLTRRAEQRLAAAQARLEELRARGEEAAASALTAAEEARSEAEARLVEFREAATRMVDDAIDAVRAQTLQPAPVRG